ncbi:unnamed protein product [Nippostrongylus brasiliensis]|uniref:Uncharacterized protein n=1 Tax=Nippostrongylus brasiliensis TaxID=27835 RepID=A0A0N4YG60_NIPBR|nr:unnamed protein product [Nippostrongylus brasiliensis]
MSDSVGGVRVLSGGGAAAKKKTSSSCPFGEGFYAKITKLLLSKDPAAKLDPADEFWDSGDEIAGVDSPSSSTTATTTSSSDIRAVPKKASAERNRLIHLDTVPGAEKRPPTKAKVDPPPVPEKKRKGPIVLPGARRSDDSDSDDAKVAEKVRGPFLDDVPVGRTIAAHFFPAEIRFVVMRRRDITSPNQVCKDVELFTH